MDVEKRDLVIVLDHGKELAEVAATAACCSGKPSAASSSDSVR